MATNNFRVKYSKSKDQQYVTIRYTGGDSISAATTLTANVYTDDFDTADRSYHLSNDELTALKAGLATISLTDLLGEGATDKWYSITITDGADYADEYGSALAGFGLTLTAKAKVYGKQGYTAVYAPDYRVDDVLHTAHMLYEELNNIEDIEASYQKREDFEQRLAILKKILRYS
jgi:hypothetical protein